MLHHHFYKNYNKPFDNFKSENKHNIAYAFSIIPYLLEIL